MACSLLQRSYPGGDTATVEQRPQGKEKAARRPRCRADLSRHSQLLQFQSKEREARRWAPSRQEQQRHESRNQPFEGKLTTPRTRQPAIPIRRLRFTGILHTATLRSGDAHGIEFSPQSRGGNGRMPPANVYRLSSPVRFGNILPIVGMCLSCDVVDQIKGQLRLSIRSPCHSWQRHFVVISAVFLSKKPLTQPNAQLNFRANSLPIQPAQKPNQVSIEDLCIHLYEFRRLARQSSRYSSCSRPASLHRPKLNLPQR